MACKPQLKIIFTFLRAVFLNSVKSMGLFLNLIQIKHCFKYEKEHNKLPWQVIYLCIEGQDNQPIFYTVLRHHFHCKLNKFSQYLMSDTTINNLASTLRRFPISFMKDNHITNKSLLRSL